ncbi:MAG: ribonuclease III [Bacteroidales bacterium]
MTKRRFYVGLVRLLGFFPRRLSLYRLAFIPKSALVGQKEGHPMNNERLEYLGDAILDAIVAEYLYTHFPEMDEGFMTKLRARIVKRKNLDQVASLMDIPRLITLGTRKEINSKHIYGNALEALVGAIYLDRGYPLARRFFVRKVMQQHMDLARLIRKDSDYKSRIIEWAQKNRVEAVFESKEEHIDHSKSPSFVSVIRLGSDECGTGRGSSKKEAEQQAAKQALKTIQ